MHARTAECVLCLMMHRRCPGFHWNSRAAYGRSVDAQQPKPQPPRAEHRVPGLPVPWRRHMRHVQCVCLLLPVRLKWNILMRPPLTYTHSLFAQRLESCCYLSPPLTEHGSFIVSYSVWRGPLSTSSCGPCFCLFFFQSVEADVMNMLNFNRYYYSVVSVYVWYVSVALGIIVLMFDISQGVGWVTWLVLAAVIFCFEVRYTVVL